MRSKHTQFLEEINQAIYSGKFKVSIGNRSSTYGYMGVSDTLIFGLRTKSMYDTNETLYVLEFFLPGETGIGLNGDLYGVTTSTRVIKITYKEFVALREFITESIRMNKDMIYDELRKYL